jgi:hypothetical protein
MTGREITEVLEQIGELEWGRHPMLSDEPGALSRPPVVAWRFKVADELIKTRIFDAVAAFHGRVEWEMVSSGRSCAILPKRVGHLQRERGYGLDVHALVALEQESPEYGEAANRDLPDLARHLRQALGIPEVTTNTSGGPELP